MCANTRRRGDEKGGEEREEAEEDERRQERGRDSPGTCGVESIVVGMEGPAVGEGYNERLAISSINIFRRFVTEGRSRRTAASRRRGRRARFATPGSVPSPRFRNYTKQRLPQSA